MHLRILIFISCIFLFQQNSFSSEKDSIVESIFSMIYNQQFELAENKLENENLDVFYSRILKLDLYWWKYSLTRSEEDANVLKRVLAEFGKTSVNNEEERINELIRFSYQMRYETKRKNYIGAFIIRSNIRKHLEVLETDNLEINGNKLELFNLYIILFQYINNVVNPFSMESKKTELTNSLLLLEKYSQKDDLILSTMAYYFLGRIYTKIETTPEKGQSHFKILVDRFPENRLFPQLADGSNQIF